MTEAETAIVTARVLEAIVPLLTRAAKEIRNPPDPRELRIKALRAELGFRDDDMSTLFEVWTRGHRVPGKDSAEKKKLAKEALAKLNTLLKKRFRYKLSSV